MLLIDTHFHFDFIKQQSLRHQFLASIKANKIEVIAQTVLPSEFEQLIKEEARPESIALGFHPWWIEDNNQAEMEVVNFKKLLHHTHLIGEIGLDFSERRLALTSKDMQEAIFKELLSSVIAEANNRQETFILSIHAVRSVTAVLDILDSLKVAEQPIIPVIHWFSGTSDELTRLIQMGCYLSINPKMLESKKGRSYVRQVPKERILLETDWPSLEIEDESELFALIEEMAHTLPTLVQKISELRQEEMQLIIERNQQKLFK